MCAAVLLDLAAGYARRHEWKITAALAVLALAFLGDIFFVASGRTALVIIPVLVLLYGFRHSGWKGIFVAGAAGLIVAGVVWVTSPYVRERVTGIYSESVLYEQTNEATSSGIRIDFWKQSLRFIETAPLAGHGTGSIPDQFQRAAAEQGGGSGFLSTNPHNQTFAVGIQLGFLGMAVLWAMWISQLLLFRGSGLLSWIGLMIVTSNIVGSLFNSFIFDFTEGWLYVIGVGVVLAVTSKANSKHREMAADPAMTRIDLPARPRILVIALRRLGDVLLTTPLIRSLRRAWPDADHRRTGICRYRRHSGRQSRPCGVVAMPAAAYRDAKPRARRRGYGADTISRSRRRRATGRLSLPYVPGARRVGPVDASFNGRLKTWRIRRMQSVRSGVHRVEEMLRLADLLGIARVRRNVVGPRSSV